MAKVLLALESYPELVFIETLLKKVGIDCIGCQNELSVSELIMSFSPDIVIANARGKKISGLKLADRIKRQWGIPCFILLSPDPQSISQSDRNTLAIQAVLESPISPESLIRAIGELIGVSPEPMIKKFQREFAEKKDLSTWISGGSSSQSSAEAQNQIERARMKRKQLQHNKVLDALPTPQQNGLQRDKVANQVKDFRSRENDPEIQAIDLERQAFVRALFKKDS